MLGIFNGNILPVEEIKISPFSRAYTFSDAVYEVREIGQAGSWGKRIRSNDNSHVS